MSDYSGPAFPTVMHAQEYQTYTVEGITKREWFAGMAMQGLCATEQGYVNLDQSDVAGLAVLQADAMIAELAKGDECE